MSIFSQPRGIIIACEQCRNMTLELAKKIVGSMCKLLEPLPLGTWWSEMIEPEHGVVNGICMFV